MKRPHYLEPEDDGLVNFRGQLMTPERAQHMAGRIMEGFDELPHTERYAWNYARVETGFNPSSSPTRNFKKKAIKAAGARALLDDLGL